MSVALLIKDSSAESTLVPVATEDTYERLWQTGAKTLDLEWVPALQAGVDITGENRAAIIDELGKLRGWFETNHPSQVVRVDSLVSALAHLRFDAGESAWIG